MRVAAIAARLVVPALLAGLAHGAAAQAFYGMPVSSTTKPDVVASADFDGDGLPDAATVWQQPFGNAHVTLLHGTGDGRLLPTAANVELSESATSLLAHDLDGDGAADLVVGTGSPSFTVFGHGDGTLSFGAQFPIGAWLRPGDCNADGVFDVLASGDGTSSVRVMLGHGDGSFDVLTAPASDKPPLEFVVADFDADGRTDAATIGSGGGTTSITVQRAQTDGSLATSAVLPLAAGKSPSMLLAGDFDGDGDEDLVARLSSPSVMLDLLLGQGDGVQFTESGTMSFGGAPEDALVLDVDVDGALDLVLLTGGVRVYPGLGTGFFGSAITTDLPEGAKSLCVTDLDLDGRKDLLCACSTAGAIVSLMGHDDGSFGNAVAVPPGANCQSIDTECGDVDGDGDLDIVDAGDFGSGSGSTVVREGSGTGTFPSWHSVSDGLSAQDFTLVDFDGDGDLDMVSRMHSGPPIQSLFFREGLGNGSFASAITTIVDTDVVDVTWADFDQDGQLDVAAACYNEDRLRILRGDPTGTFTQIAQLPVTGHPRLVRHADLDLDGVEDVMSLNYLPVLSRIMGTGGGGFAPAINASVSTDPKLFLLGDFVGDEAPDLVLNEFLPAGNWGLHVQPGLGNGNFDLGTSLVTTGSPLRTGDVDGDGHTDLLLSDGSHLVSVVLVRPDGLLTFAGSGFVGAYGGGKLAVGDLDADGRLDVVAPATVALAPLRILLHKDTPVGAWTNLGHPLAGVAGAPKLVGSGALEPGSSGSLTLSQSAPSALAVLFASLSATPTPFKGGKLVAFPPAAMIPLATNGDGGLALPWASWPAGLSGVSLCFQFAIQDAAAVHGVALSNAVQSTVP